MAKQVYYFDYDEDEIIKCTDCSWQGKSKNGSIEYYQDLFDVSCPKCFEMILIIPYSLIEDVKREAKKGNKEAKYNLAQVLWIEQIQKNLKSN